MGHVVCGIVDEEVVVLLGGVILLGRFGERSWSVRCPAVGVIVTMGTFFQAQYKC